MALWTQSIPRTRVVSSDLPARLCGEKFVGGAEEGISAIRVRASRES